MGMFRLWQPYEDAYMLAWNGLVAKHTSEKLSEKAAEVVTFKASLLCAHNNIDPEKREQLALASYFLSLALAGEGIHPILDRSPAKWFWLVDPIGANARLIARGDEVVERVIRDLWSKHGIRPSPDSSAIRCIYCSEAIWVPARRGTFKVRCPTCKGVWSVKT